MEKPGVCCPTCGRSIMKPVTRDIRTRRAGKAVVVKDVAIEECTHCGERL
jgi:YgiT-type zinc finger domain-containing protein